MKFENDAERLHNLLSLGADIKSASLAYTGLENHNHEATVTLELIARAVDGKLLKIQAYKVKQYKSDDNDDCAIELEVADVSDHQIEGVRFSFGTGHGTTLKFLCHAFQVGVLDIN